MLVSFQLVAERALRESDQRIAVIDVDLRNAFPSLEWASIRKAVEHQFGSLKPWVNWSHQTPSRVHLPAGDVVEVDRGVEQGDPLGGILAAATIHAVMEDVRQELSELDVQFFDVWYLDDGQIFCSEHDVDRVLRTLDAKFAGSGASRGTGDEVKSTARVLGAAGVTPGATVACPLWPRHWHSQAWVA